MTGRRQPELDRAVQLVGAGAAGVRGDVANLADLDRLYEAVRTQAGMIDILVANAGGGEFLPLGAITEDHFDRTFGTNVRGVLFTVQEALPLFRDGGSIILMGSVTGSVGTPAFSVYSASKAAVRSFARNWILDLAPRRMRVNVLAPGATITPGWQGLAEAYWNDRPGHEPSVRAAHLSRAVTMGRHVGSDPERGAYCPDLWEDELAYLNRPGVADIQLELIYDYRTNILSYPAWQAWMRSQQKPTLVIWGRHDLAFTPGGAAAFTRDVPLAEVHIIDAGHFAMDTRLAQVTELTRSFLDRKIGR